MNIDDIYLKKWVYCEKCLLELTLSYAKYGHSVYVKQQLLYQMYQCKDKHEMYRTRLAFEITFIRYAQSRKIGKANNLSILGTITTKGTNQDNQNRIRSCMPEGGDS